MSLFGADLTVMVSALGSRTQSEPGEGVRSNGRPEKDWDIEAP
jgi:hypothetical protein